MELKFVEASSWMRDSLHIIGMKKLRELILPGTHDTAAYRFTKEVMPGTQSGFVDFLISNTGTLLDKTIEKMEKTQEIDTYHQMLAGARYLDVRAGYINDTWVTYHCHIGDSLEIILEDINQFLEQHECEIAIVEISHFKIKANEEEAKVNLHSLIKSKLGKFLYPVDYSLDFNVFDMVNRNKRAIVCLSKFEDEANHIWKNKFIKNSYPNKSDIEQVRNFNKRKVENWKNKTKEWHGRTDLLYKISYILTPDYKHYHKSLLKTALVVNDDLLRFYNQLVKYDKKIIFGHIIILDNFAKSEIMRIIYKMNQIID